MSRGSGMARWDRCSEETACPQTGPAKNEEPISSKSDQGEKCLFMRERTGARTPRIPCTHYFTAPSGSLQGRARFASSMPFSPFLVRQELPIHGDDHAI